LYLVNIHSFDFHFAWMGLELFVGFFPLRGRFNRVRFYGPTRSILWGVLHRGCDDRVPLIGKSVELKSEFSLESQFILWWRNTWSEKLLNWQISSYLKSAIFWKLSEWTILNGLSCVPVIDYSNLVGLYGINYTWSDRIERIDCICGTRWRYGVGEDASELFKSLPTGKLIFLITLGLSSSRGET